MGRLLNSWRRAAAFFLALGAFGGTQPAAAESYSFGVIPQRSAVLTAQYWNPILDYAGRKAGVELLLKVARSGKIKSLQMRGKLIAQDFENAWRKEWQKQNPGVKAKTVAELLDKLTEAGAI